MPLSGDDVRAARFAATRFREGYDPEQVDDLLDRVAGALDVAARGGIPELGPDDVTRAAFTATKFRSGYDQEQVDDLLDRVVEALREGLRDRSSTTS